MKRGRRRRRRKTIGMGTLEITSKKKEKKGGRGGSDRGNKGGSAKDGSYDGVSQESTPATGSPEVESYALVIEAWA